VGVPRGAELIDSSGRGAPRQIDDDVTRTTEDRRAEALPHEQLRRTAVRTIAGLKPCRTQGNSQPARSQR
jgi:hypothetical protein